MVFGCCRTARACTPVRSAKVCRCAEAHAREQAGWALTLFKLRTRHAAAHARNESMCACDVEFLCCSPSNSVEHSARPEKGREGKVVVGVRIMRHVFCVCVFVSIYVHNHISRNKARQWAYIVY